jgi:hypothetical protein
VALSLFAFFLHAESELCHGQVLSSGFGGFPDCSEQNVKDLKSLASDGALSMIAANTVYFSVSENVRSN